MLKGINRGREYKVWEESENRGIQNVRKKQRPPYMGSAQ
jgi:hypothetical protein